MTSEILAELKSLSQKVSLIQREISQLYKIIDKSVFKGQRDVSQCHHSIQETLTEHGNPEESLVNFLTEEEHSLNINQEESNERQSPDSFEFPNQKMNELTFAGDTCTTSPKTPRKKSETPERPLQSLHKRFKECRQECLRRALQQNIVHLVDNLPCSENDILDMLIENECLTETECSDLRNTGSKDCVRNMIRKIKGRSYIVMKTFLECVKTLHPEVAASVWQSYEKLVKDKQNYSRLCTFCVLKRSTDLKFIADHTWSVGAISDELYDEIVEGRTDTEILWTKLADECNNSKLRQNALRKVSEALVKKGQYRELVLKLNNVKEFTCRCVKFCVASGDHSVLGSIRIPDIVVVDSEENSTASPLSTPTSSLSFTEENEIATDDDRLPFNENASYLLLPWTSEYDTDFYSSCFGIRKGAILAQCAVDDGLRQSRSNSFGKNIGQRKLPQSLLKRRASMFM